MAGGFEVILRPEKVVLICFGAAPEVINGVDAISVMGGEPVPGDARFSLGFKTPESVGIVLKGGERKRIDNIQVVLIKGGVGQSASTPLIGADSGLSRRMITDDGGVGLGQIENLRDEGQYIGEIEKYLQDKEKAAREVGNDDFRMRMQMQKNEIKALNQTAPFTRDNPASLVTGMLGRQITITGPGANSGDPVFSDPILVARWDGADIDARDVSCVFGSVITFDTNTVLPSPASGVTQGLQPIGIVQFGTSGYLVTVEVDITLGAQLTVCGSTVLMSVKTAGPAVSTTVTGMISMHLCRSRRLTRTVYRNALPRTATSGLIIIPPFATSVYIYRYDLINGVVPPFTVSFRNSNNEPNHVVTTAIDVPFNSGQSLPLPGDAYFLRIINNNASDPGPTNFGCVFDISI